MDFLHPFLTTNIPGHPAWVWLACVGVFAALLALDLRVPCKNDRDIGVREKTRGQPMACEPT